MNKSIHQNTCYCTHTQMYTHILDTKCYVSHTHTYMMQRWIMGCCFEASCLKDRNCITPSHASFDLQMNAALMENGAAYSCHQSALTDYEPAFVFHILFFIMRSDVLSYKNVNYFLRKVTKQQQAASHIYDSQKAAKQNIFNSQKSRNVTQKSSFL